MVSEDGEIALSPPWDVELVSVDNWSGELSPGESHAMTYRVFLTADLPPGTYRGSVTLRSDVEGASTETPVELTFEVER